MDDYDLGEDALLIWWECYLNHAFTGICIHLTMSIHSQSNTIKELNSN